MSAAGTGIFFMTKNNRLWVVAQSVNPLGTLVHIGGIRHTYKHGVVMANLRDLAIDLINDAKNGKKASATLYNLEQVKEIVFHRDTTILSELAPDVINDFMVERSTAIRKFLMSFASGWLQRDFPAALPVTLAMYSFLLASDSSDGSLKQIAGELTRLYDRAVVHIVGLPIKARAVSGADPKSYWGSLRSIVTRLTDMISSDRAEQLRAQSLKLAENMVMFGLPAEQVSLDPRLARSRAAAAGGDGSKASVTNIPLTHPFINRNDLEQEAEALFSKMLLWASKGGPQGHPFTPSQMVLLGTMIANIASLRPKKSSNAATALAVLLTGKGNMCAAMTGVERDQLARAIQNLLRAAKAQADPDNLMGKLRTALDAMVKLGVETAPPPAAGALKRDRDEEDEEDATTAGLVSEELGQSAAALRASAIAAVDAAANNIITKQPRTTTSQADVVAVAAPSSTSAVTADTELASDLADFPDSKATDTRLVALSIAQPGTHTSSLSSSGMVVKPIPPSIDTYVEMAIKSLQRVLESYHDIKNCGPKAIHAHMKLSARLVVSMALTDIAEGRQAPLRVVVVASLSPAAAGSLLEDVSMDVAMPRVLWLVLSYCLSTVTSAAAVVRSQKIEGLPKEKVDLITCILSEIHTRIVPVDAAIEQRATDGAGAGGGAGGGVDEGGSEGRGVVNPLRAMYTSACVSVLARALQTMTLRPAAKDVAMALPSVPSSVLALLRLLVYTGTRATAAPAPSAPSSRRDTAPRNRGTRAEAIALLGQLVFSNDETAGQKALELLLWCTVSDDFEIRGKAIAMLVGEVVPMADWALETVTMFAVQAICACVGSDKVAARLVHLSSSGEGPDPEAMVDGAPAETSETGGAEGGREQGGQEPSVTVEYAMESFDMGERFHGAFVSCPSFSPPSSSGSGGSGSREKTEGHVRKSLHLLTQVCIAEPSLLSTLYGLYGAAAAAAAEEARSTGSAVGGQKEVEPAPSTDGKDGSAPVPVVPVPPAVATGSNKYEIMCALIEKELESIVPVVARRMGAAELFTLLSSHRIDPLARPLLERALDTMHPDYHTPATSDIIDRVRSYIASSAFTATLLAGTEDIPALRDAAEVRLLVPLLGGLPSADVLLLLPRILRTYAAAGTSDTAVLNALRRIYAARPPALPKAALFAALHRLDIEAAGLPQKTVLDSIQLCLNSKDDFRSEVLREAMTDLLADEVPAQALMRTAILAAQSHGNEMKKFMLSDVVPSIIRKKVWTTAPKVWDGVAHAVKSLAEHKNAEPTLRCLLGLPKAQLRAILKAAPKAKAPLGKLLNALSAEEKEECTSGKWAGIDEVDQPVDPEKTKILKDIAAAGT